MKQPIEKIKTAFERVKQAIIVRPSVAKGNIATKATLREGLVCDVEADTWKLTADMPVKVGGTETAPTPGHYMSAAIGSCQTICIAM